MPSFYLQSIDENGGTTTKSFDSNYLDEVVDYVDDFLRGSGFCFSFLSRAQKLCYMTLNFHKKKTALSSQQKKSGFLNLNVKNCSFPKKNGSFSLKKKNRPSLAPEESQ